MNREFKDWGVGIIGLLAVVIINALANSIPLGGQTTGQISAQYPSLFTPAGYAFGIWGLIYLSLLVYVVYQALPAQRASSSLARISKPWLYSCGFNILWIFLWHFGFLALSLVAMLGILVSLLVIYRELDLANNTAPLGQQCFVHFPFSLYTGWISVATLANLSALQTGMGMDNLLLTATAWTQIKLAMAGVIAVVFVCFRRDITAALVVAWAAWAIGVKQAAEPAVAGAAQTLTGVVLLLVLLELVRRFYRFCADNFAYKFPR